VRVSGTMGKYSHSPDRRSQRCDHWVWPERSGRHADISI